MFNPDFYPTKRETIAEMLNGVEISGRTFLEPEAGAGHIVDYLNEFGAGEVLICEINDDLSQICKHKGTFLKHDFLLVQAHEISHIDAIVMNPPFSADEKHILHAFDIAPAGCEIIALANWQTIKNPYSAAREQLKSIIGMYGTAVNLGNCFADAERRTGAEIALIRLQKPADTYKQEFDGFFMDDEPEAQGTGIMSYNIIRDLVNRYVESIKIFDKQLEAAGEMNALTKGYFSVNIGMSLTNNDKPIQRNTFKKEMQKSGWNFIFGKLNMAKYMTRGLKEDINKFVEDQQNIPFTMRNIYHMINIVIGTTSQRMDKAILEAFDKITLHYHDNRHNLEGWKTNSHYLLNKRFIFPNMVKAGWSGEVSLSSHSNVETIEDLVKAICFLTGDDYGKKIDLYNFLRYRFKLVDANGDYISDDYFKDCNIIITSDDRAKLENKLIHFPGATIQESVLAWGQWNEWGYFRFRPYKKGTIHFEFLDTELLGRFNQKIAELKGFPLFEKASYRKPERKAKPTKAPAKSTNHNQPATKPIILGTFNIKSTN